MQATMLRGQLCNKVSQLLVLFFQLHKPRMHSSHIQLQQFVRQGSQFRVFLLVWHDGESRIGNAAYFLVGVIRYHWSLLIGVSLDCWWVGPHFSQQKTPVDCILRKYGAINACLWFGEIDLDGIPRGNDLWVRMSPINHWPKSSPMREIPWVISDAL